MFLLPSWQVQQPSLMITTGKDGLIRPQFCAKMDQWVKKTIMLKLNHCVLCHIFSIHSFVWFVREKRLWQEPITRSLQLPQQAKYATSFLDQSIFRYFSHEIGHEHTLVRIKQCGLTWTCQHHVDMSTLVCACDCNWSLRFLWGSEFEINSS